MKFIDKLTIDIASGAGGSGIVSFNRTRTRQLPDGGNGGHGGSVYLIGTAKHHGLGHLKHKRWQAADGSTGQKGNKTGENGSALDIPIPIGTRVYERQSGNLLLTVDAPRRYLLTAGGKAGVGNGSNPRPRSTKGEDGTKLTLLLDYHLQTDVALVGIANSGKSTLLNRISNAKAKTAPYPFTTQTPQLGSCDMSEHYQPPLSITEIPSHRFTSHLKHLLYCQVIIYVATGKPDDYANQLQPLFSALRDYDEALMHKHALIAAAQSTGELPPYVAMLGRMLPVLATDKDIRILTSKLFQLCQRQ